MVTLEYAVLGLLAGSLGAIGAAVLSWALARYLFAIEWQASPWLFLGGVAVVVAVVGVVGLLASADVLVRKPLATLRSEA
jgi:putative ABC transport system permease protein